MNYLQDATQVLYFYSQLPAWCNILHWGAGGVGDGLCNVVGGAVANKNNASHVELVVYVQGVGKVDTHREGERNESVLD